MDNQFVWVNFYKEFASKLLAYKNNRGELVEKVKAIYAETGINMPTLEKDNQLVDIDPFTVFGLFNKSSMREANRIKIITAVRKIFDVVTAVPDSFDSIPVLNNQNATFYYFIDSRGDEDIDDLWNLFDSALKYAADAKYYEHTTQTQYDKHTLHSNNLYQIFTYVKNKEYELREEQHEVAGMLLYAKTEEEIQPDQKYKMSGNRISVRTLDLNLDFSEIRKQLDGIVEEYFEEAV